MQNLKTKILRFAIGSNLRTIIKQLIIAFDKLTAFVPCKGYQIVILADFDPNTKPLAAKFDNYQVKYLKFSILSAPAAAFWARRCSVLYVDNLNIVVSSLDLDCTIIQLWHATSAVKQFGLGSQNELVDKQVLRQNFAKYDYITANSTFMHNLFVTNFGVADKQILDIGCLASQPLFNAPKQPQAEPYILYVPTFRWDQRYTAQSLEFIQNYDCPDYQLLYCLHPKVEAKIDNPHARQITNSMVRDYLAGAKLVISDYSSLLIDASLVCNQVAMYAYDYDEYRRNPGLAIDRDKFWGYFTTSSSQLTDYIASQTFITHDPQMIKE